MSHLIWIQGEVGVQQLSRIIIRLAFVNLVCRVPDLDVHGSIGHPLVLESLSSADTNTSEQLQPCPRLFVTQAEPRHRDLHSHIHKVAYHQANHKHKDTATSTRVSPAI